MVCSSALRAGPPGMSRNNAYVLPAKWQGRDCLIPVDVATIHEIKAAMRGDELLEFVSYEFRLHAEAAYQCWISGSSVFRIYRTFSILCYLFCTVKI